MPKINRVNPPPSLWRLKHLSNEENPFWVKINGQKGLSLSPPQRRWCLVWHWAQGCIRLPLSAACAPYKRPVQKRMGQNQINSKRCCSSDHYAHQIKHLILTILTNIITFFYCKYFKRYYCRNKQQIIGVLSFWCPYLLVSSPRIFYPIGMICISN